MTTNILWGLFLSTIIAVYTAAAYAPDVSPFKDITETVDSAKDLSGSSYILYEADKEEPTDEEMSAAVSMLRQRLDNNNIYEASVSAEDKNNIRVIIPSSEDGIDIDELAAEISVSAHLTFCDTQGNILVDGSYITDAQAVATGPQSYAVMVTFDSEGTKLFAQATQELIGQPLLIMMDDTVISAPTVNQSITGGQAQITGDFTLEDTVKLADNIRSGSLPFTLKISETGLN